MIWDFLLMVEVLVLFPFCLLYVIDAVHKEWDFVKMSWKKFTHKFFGTVEVGSKWKLKDADLFVRVTEVKGGKVFYYLMPSRLANGSSTTRVFKQLYSFVDPQQDSDCYIDDDYIDAEYDEEEGN